MNLLMPSELAWNYKSPAQIARVVSEAWGKLNLYCPNCPARWLNPTAANTQAYDYSCLDCHQHFQLKCMSSPIGRRILDAAFGAMMRAINEDRTPNLFALHYDRKSWLVKNLILIPHFALSASAIEPRKPLGVAARRAGWVGCFIVLEKIPPDARIHLVREGVVEPSSRVRHSYSRLRPLEDVPVEERGWMLDVLRVVHGLGKKQFTNSDVYQFTPELEKLHPENRHAPCMLRIDPATSEIQAAGDPRARRHAGAY
jgi:type II restriction enzyme